MKTMFEPMIVLDKINNFYTCAGRINFLVENKYNTNKIFRKTLKIKHKYIVTKLIWHVWLAVRTTNVLKPCWLSWRLLNKRITRCIKMELNYEFDTKQIVYHKYKLQKLVHHILIWTINFFNDFRNRNGIYFNLGSTRILNFFIFFTKTCLRIYIKTAKLSWRWLLHYIKYYEETFHSHRFK